MSFKAKFIIELQLQIDINLFETNEIYNTLQVALYVIFFS